MGHYKIIIQDICYPNLNPTFDITLNWPCMLNKVHKGSHLHPNLNPQPQQLNNIICRYKPMFHKFDTWLHAIHDTIWQWYIYIYICIPLRYYFCKHCIIKYQTMCIQFYNILIFEKFEIKTFVNCKTQNKKLLSNVCSFMWALTV